MHDENVSESEMKKEVELIKRLITIIFRICIYINARRVQVHTNTNGTS